MAEYHRHVILSSQVVSLPLQFVIQEIANFCASMDTVIDQDVDTLAYLVLLARRMTIVGEFIIFVC